MLISKKHIIINIGQSKHVTFMNEGDTINIKVRNTTENYLFLRTKKSSVEPGLLLFF